MEGLLSLGDALAGVNKRLPRIVGFQMGTGEVLPLPAQGECEYLAKHGCEDECEPIDAANDLIDRLVRLLGE